MNENAEPKRASIACIIALIATSAGCAGVTTEGDDGFEPDTIEPPRAAVDAGVGAPGASAGWGADGGVGVEDGGPDGDGEGASRLGGPSGGGFVAATDDPCRTLSPTIRGTQGADVLIGTDGRDVIFGLSGDDRIWGNGGDDVICAGGGADEVYGGAGDDYVDAGFGRDVVDGGAGHDVLHGRSGGDMLRGRWGDDVLFGDLLDDRMYGDEGDDLLIGGHGIDRMHGGEGADWLRGDTNRDEAIGGIGDDTFSFMTATPPGQPLGSLARAEGVLVDNRDTANARASGDGYDETLQGIENIVGSAFDDHLVTGGATRSVDGGPGADRIEAAAGTSVSDPPSGRGEGPFVALATPSRDLGLVVLGSRGPVDDALRVSIDGGVVVVRATNGAEVTAGRGCARGVTSAEVRCVLGSVLRYIVGYGGEGDDAIVLDEHGFPRDMTATLDGGEGDDRLVGHEGEDILFAGRSGDDVLMGRGGDDALLSLSEDGDQMDAGAGNDQLVSNHPCAGHRFVGGPGFDVGGFARVGTSFDTAAERHRQRIRAQIGYRAYQPALCARDQGTQLADDIEILEGAGGDDELIGNDGPNVIWGWGGDDVIRGLGGDDTIEGHRGDDTIYGGAGRDRLRGNRGYDVLHARDGERDRELDCAGGRLASADGADPGGRGCR